MNGDASMGGDGTISDGLVEGNIIHDNGAGGASGINMDGVTNTMIRNNLLYNNHASGISLYKIDGAVCSSYNQVLNNTIVMAPDGRWVLNIPRPRGGKAACVGNKVFNNILYHPDIFYGAGRGSILIHESTSSGFESDYNVVVDRFSTNGGKSLIDLAGWQALGHDLNSFIATPEELFVPGNNDYHLQTGSLAIDAGIALTDVAEDLDGVPRPQGHGYDIGAYEDPDEPRHDVAVTAVSVPSSVTIGDIVSVGVDLLNQGDFTETVDVTLTDETDGITIGDHADHSSRP